jgi:hypothetical protein
MAQRETSRPFAARLFAGLTRRPGRAVALPLVGAAAGLGLALVSLLGPAPAPVTTVPAGYVALVNQHPILMSDFVTETETIAGKPFAQATAAERSAILRGMIDEELLVQRALVLNLPELDTETRKVLVDGVNSVVMTRTTPTDDDLVAYFNTHRERYQAEGRMRVRDIVLHVGGYQNANQTVDQAMADAQEAAYQLRSGAALDQVMQHFSLVDSGRSKGGDEFDFAAKLHLGDKLFAVAATLTNGEISDPVVEGDGVHIVMMEERRAPRPADFTASRGKVYADYRTDQQLRARAENLKFLRSNAQILLAPGQRE